MPQSVLILRPEPGNTTTAARVRALGFDAICLPLFEVRPVDWACPDPHAFDGVLLTSANTILHAGSQIGKLTHLRTYAVGPATAEAAKAVGFSRIETGPSNVKALLKLIAASDGKHHILHLGRGDHIASDYKQINVTPLKIYDIIPTDVSLSECVLDQNPVIALLHSPQAGARFSCLIGAAPELRSRITLLAISEATATIAGNGWRRVAIAPEPRDEAMLSLLPRMQP